MDPSAAPTLTRSTRSMKSSMIGADQKLKGASVDLLSSKTPEKSMQLRGRNRGVALSVKDVKQVAKGLHGSETVRSATKRQLLSSSDGKSKSKSKAVDENESGSSSKLPEKCEMLCETFHSLDCVVRLMRMKGVAPVFSNVCRKVEQLTERRFTNEQLAQMKFVLPEVMVLKKVSVLDEATSCMKYDIHVSFELDAIKSDGKDIGGSGRPQLTKVFRSRLLDFFKFHSEDTEIPEGPLPEPFARPSEGLPPSTFGPTNSPVTVAAEPAADHLVEDSVTASHISSSFRKRFSQKFGSNEDARSYASDTPQTSELATAKSRLSRCTFTEVVDVHVTLPQMEDSDEVPHSDPAKVPAPCPSSSSLHATPSKQITSMNTSQIIEKTPSKSGTIPASPMTATPVPLTPKRSLMSPDDHSNKTSNKLVRRALRTRSLKFDTPTKEDEDESNRVKLASLSTIDSELANTLDEDLLQSILEKERKVREESDPAISQAKRRRDMIAGLPKLFNMVHFYFRSIKRSVVTKEELIHKMIASHSDFLDKREVEEQLKLLQELVPEYISETIALSGDDLIRVNKASNADFIRARLSEAMQKKRRKDLTLGNLGSVFSPP